MRFLDPNGRFPDQNQGFGSDGDPVARTLLSTTLVSLLSQNPRRDIGPNWVCFQKDDWWGESSACGAVAWFS